MRISGADRPLKARSSSDRWHLDVGQLVPQNARHKKALFCKLFTLMTSPFLPLMQFLLLVLSFLIVWLFAGYPLLMTVISLRLKPQTKDYNYQPFVSIFVPTHNEEISIERRIDNLYRLDYPKQNYEIIVIDSGSTDKTRQIVQRLIEHNGETDLPSLNLVKEAQRNGKGAAINAGMSHAQGEIILVTDANCLFSINALKELAPHFKNPKVGAVGGRYVVLNPDNALTLATKFYRDLEHVLRTGESALCSACLFDGEINAWRKNLADIDKHMIAEDLDMCIKIRKKGYKIDYEPEAVVYEAVPTTLQEQVKQRKRTSIGTITSMLNNLKYILVPSDLYRLLILPSHKGLAMLSPYLLLAVPVLYFAMQDWAWVLLHGAGSIIAFGLIFALLTLGRKQLGKRYRTERANVTTMARMVWYTLLNACIVLAAWKDVVTRNYTVQWEMVRTTRR
jgi:cellulose synthase/poly-beta-1,6-N-acetylglucosamine synthase-like glycosyltransferase